jgi:hypothetical protein
MSSPPSYWSALWARPAALPLLSRYIIANGILYLAMGAGMYALPASVLMRIFSFEHLEGYEPAFLRMLGIAAIGVGWLYLMGGRTGTVSYGLSCVIDRILVPAALLPIWLAGSAPAGFLLTFAILDPILAIGAYVIWRRERTRLNP